MKWIIAIGLLAVLTGLLAGCGGGDDGSVRGSTRLLASIAWAERSRSLTGPSSALSAVITAVQARPDGRDMQFTVDRPDGADAQTVEYVSTEAVLTGRHTVQVRFYAGKAGTGDVVGVASDVAEIKPDGSGLAELTTTGLVATVQVPAGQRVPEGGSRALAAAVYSSTGTLIAVAPDAIFWTVTGGADRLRITQGMAQGIRHGQARVHATVDGKASASVDVDVVVAPGARLVPLLPGADEASSVNTSAAITPDGRWVVGWSECPEGVRAYRWDRWSSDPPVNLGTLPGYGARSMANAISSDGSVVVGACTNDANVWCAFRWTEATGMQVIPDMPPDAGDSNAMAVSADGRMVVGSYADGDDRYGFYWSEATGFGRLADLQDLNADKRVAEAVAVNADGSRILLNAAWDVSDTGLLMTQPVMVRPGLSYTPMGGLDLNAPDATASWMDAKGTLVLGYSMLSDQMGTPVRWTPSSGWVAFSPRFVTIPHCASEDGAVMAGGGADPGDAFIWSHDEGYRNLYNVMRQFNIIGLLEGRSPQAIFGCSADGQVMVGDCGLPFRGFVLTIPR